MMLTEESGQIKYIKDQEEDGKSTQNKVEVERIKESTDPNDDVAEEANSTQHIELDPSEHPLLEDQCCTDVALNTSFYYKKSAQFKKTYAALKESVLLRTLFSFLENDISRWRSNIIELYAMYNHVIRNYKTDASIEDSVRGKLPPTGELPPMGTILEPLKADVIHMEDSANFFPFDYSFHVQDNEYIVYHNGHGQIIKPFDIPFFISEDDFIRQKFVTKHALLNYSPFEFIVDNDNDDSSLGPPMKNDFYQELQDLQNKFISFESLILNLIQVNYNWDTTAEDNCFKTRPITNCLEPEINRPKQKSVNGKLSVFYYRGEDLLAQQFIMSITGKGYRYAFDHLMESTSK